MTNKLLFTVLFLNIGLAGATSAPPLLFYLASGAFGAQAAASAISIKAFDKKNAKYEEKDFGDAAADAIDAKAEEA